MSIVRLFDIENGHVIPTEHCYSFKTLREVMEEYAADKQYLKIYQYCFYMTCPDPDLNPCFHMRTDEKEEFILHEIEIDFSLDDTLIIDAITCCTKIYATETSRAYYGIKSALDNMADAMNKEITFGRDGNAAAILRIAEKFDSVRQSYKGVYKDLMEEQKSTVRGNQNLSYDTK